MRRRTVLTVAGSSLVGFAGCTGGIREASPTESSSRRSTEAQTETDDATMGIDVQLDPAEYYVMTIPPSTRGGIDPDDVVPEDEIPQVLRDALGEALDDGFETDSVSDDLLAAIDEFRPSDGDELEPYVRLDGTAYVFDPHVPTFTAQLADEEADEYDPERVAEYRDEFETEAVETFVQRLAIRGTHTPRSEYRTSLVPEAVEEFLEQYDFIDDPEGVSRIQTQTLDSDPPYSIEIRELDDEDRWGEPIVDGEDMDESHREFFEAATESDQRAPATQGPSDTRYMADEVPEPYFESLQSDDEYTDDLLVRLDGTFHRIVVLGSQYDSIPAEVSTGTASSTADGQQEFWLTVRATDGGPETELASDTTVDISSPGGVPSVLWIQGEDERYLLESDAYREDLWEDTTDDAAVSERVSGLAEEEMEVGEEVSATYTVPAELPEGTHVSRGIFRLRWEDDGVDTLYAGAFYPFRLTVTVGSQ